MPHADDDSMACQFAFGGLDDLWLMSRRIQIGRTKRGRIRLGDGSCFDFPVFRVS